MKRLLTAVELFAMLAVLLLALTLSAVNATTPKPPVPPRPPVTTTSVYVICRPGYGCYRPDPPPVYTPTPSACLPPPGCNPAVESCAAVCYPQKVGNA